MAGSQILIFNQDGEEPRELEAEVASLSWSDMRITYADIVIPRTSTAINRSLIAHMNMVLIKTKNLRPWAGFIWLPETWTRDQIKIKAVSGLKYLSKRFPKHSFGKNMTAGGAVLRMFQMAKRNGEMLVDINKDDVVTKGATLGEKGVIRENNSILNNMSRLAEAHGYEFWLENRFRNNTLQFNLIWDRRKANNGSPIEIGDGGNAEWGEPAMVKSGDITTAWLVNEEEKLRKDGERVLMRAETPIEKYGYLEGLLSVEKINTGDARSREFVRAVQEQGKPKKNFKVKVEIGAMSDGKISKQIETGNIHELHGPGIGYSKGKKGIDTKVRIQEVQYREGEGYLGVMATEWQGTEFKDWIP